MMFACPSCLPLPQAREVFVGGGLAALANFPADGRILPEDAVYSAQRNEVRRAGQDRLPFDGTEREALEMTREELLKRISIDPNVCFGKPVVRGTRIWVSLILDFLSGGDSTEEILQEYPQLTREDILACIAYGAEVARERFVPISMESTG
jgi:uncharacterized protein (DUF433 family)